MIIFWVFATIYISILIFFRPQPASLRERPSSIYGNFRQIKASLFTGILLLMIFLITTNNGFSEIDGKFYVMFCLTNIPEAAILWPFQIITHLFVHVNLVHVLSNVIGIGIASAYERRVGSRRFIIVLLVGAFSSAPSVFFYPVPTVTCGISGGVFALGAAYFTDQKNLTAKEWVYAILAFLMVVLLFTLYGNIRSGSNETAALNTDHLGHFLGAVGGIIYCRLRPIKSK